MRWRSDFRDGSPIAGQLLFGPQRHWRIEDPRPIETDDERNRWSFTAVPLGHWTDRPMHVFHWCTRDDLPVSRATVCAQSIRNPRAETRPRTRIEHSA